MILIASPSKALCRRWRDALAGAFPIHEISDKHALVHFLNEVKPAVLFLDYDNRCFGSIAFLHKVIQASPSTRVVVFTSNPKPYGAVTALMSGAKGYGPKNLSRSLLRKAAHAVSDDEIWIGRKLVSSLMRELVGNNPVSKNNALKLQGNEFEADTLLDALSPREREIASMIAIGEYNKAIASHLNISEKTVKAHLTSIFKKLGLSSRTQLALYVSQNNFFQNPSIPSPSTKTTLNLRAVLH